MVKIASAVLILIAMLLIAGCGSDSQSSAINQEREAYETYETEEEAYPTEEETPVETEVGGPLSYLGKITATDDEGTTVSNSYSVGPIMYGYEETPPEEIASECSVNVPESMVATTIFIRGEVTINYEEGRLPFQPDTGVPELVKALHVDNSDKIQGYGRLAINVGGEWYCYPGNVIPLEFQAGESQTFPFWIVIPNVISNSKLKIPPGEYNDWYMSFIGPYLHVVTVTGPGTLECMDEQNIWGEEEKFLFLYNRSGSCE